jgi:hypothetical protein
VGSEKGCELVKIFDIIGEDLPDSRPLDFDDDIATISKPRRVNLTEGR